MNEPRQISVRFAPKAIRDRSKPGPDDYQDWLGSVWMGDSRELRPGRYLQQQRELQTAFNGSPFMIDLRHLMPEWATRYHEETNVSLFPGEPPAIDLKLKPWESFLSRTWRQNVLWNADWPAPPPGGWWAPDCWFEKLWDIVRTRITVRYLDGVQFLVERITELGHHHGLRVEQRTHAQERGYYAMHVTVSQEFPVQSLDFEKWQKRSSSVEIQLTTELKEVIGDLTHGYFEELREDEGGPNRKWQWDYESPEFAPYYLGHILHYLEGMIMQIRDATNRGGTQ